MSRHDATAGNGLGIDFGAMALPLHTQIHRQGCYVKSPVPYYPMQELADAITMAAVHGILTDASAHAARKRLMKQITRRIARRTDERSRPTQEDR